MYADLSDICKSGLVSIPCCAGAKPAIVEDAAMQLLGHMQLLSHPVAHPDFQHCAGAVTAAPGHQSTLACLC